MKAETLTRKIVSTLSLFNKLYKITLFTFFITTVFLILLMQSVIAANVFSSTVDIFNPFIIEELPFRISMYSDGTIIVYSELNRVILIEKECKSQDKYLFCYVQRIDRGEDYLGKDRYQVNLKVDTICDKCVPLGKICTQNSDCASHYCVHDICRTSKKYCGDTFCDDDELCQEDCQKHYYVKMNIPSTHTNIQLKSESIYHLDINTSEKINYCMNSLFFCFPLNDMIFSRDGTLILKNLVLDYKNNLTIPIQLFELTESQQKLIKQSSGEIIKALNNLNVPNVEHITPKLYEIFSLLNEISLLEKMAPQIVTIMDTEIISFNGNEASSRVNYKLNTNNLDALVYWKLDNSNWQAYEILYNNKNLTVLFNAQDLRAMKQSYLTKLTAPQPIIQTIVPLPVQSPIPQKSMTKESSAGLGFSMWLALVLTVMIGVLLFDKKAKYGAYLKNERKLTFPADWLDFITTLGFKGNSYVLIGLGLLGFLWYPFFFMMVVYYLGNTLVILSASKFGDIKHNYSDDFTKHNSKKESRIKQSVKSEPITQHKSADVKQHILDKELIQRYNDIRDSRVTDEEKNGLYVELGKSQRKNNGSFTKEEKHYETFKSSKISLDDNDTAELDRNHNKNINRPTEEETHEIYSIIKNKAKSHLNVTPNKQIKEIVSIVSRRLGSNYTSKDIVQETQKSTIDDNMIIQVMQLIQNCSFENAEKIYLDIKKLNPQTTLALPNFDKIDSMGGHEFEEFVQNIFESQGYETTRNKKSRDNGADIIVKIDGRIIAIQVKLRGPGKYINNKAIQEIHSAKSIYKADEAWVITNRDFTPPAREVALEHKVQLWNRHRLKEEYDKIKLIRGIK